MGGSGHPKQDNLGNPAVHPQPERLPGADAPQDRELGAAGIHPPGGSGAATPGAREALGQPLPVPLAPHRGDVPPGLGGEPTQEDSEGRRPGASQIP